jgi:eukaryotic-like serine/threonine-protein kinase
MSRQLELGNGSLEARLGQVADEFTDRINRGERPEVEDYARRYPEMAGVLRQVLPALQVMGPGPAPTEPGGAEAAGEALASGRLGDFRLLREVGRGGMGVVYEAEQVSLGRRVALKVLPLAATMDPRQRQRFHNEARAAACLHHTNIVPVYGVGSERGVHYYAMQFIDGRTLADFIAQQRQGTPSQAPTSAEAEAAASATTLAAAAQATGAAPRGAAYFRRVAEWGAQAAEALDCAHTLGVVHRDVKPANLMVDGTGRLWVTDFGLAQVQSDARLTLTGDLVGTLRYMSPEQALAKRVVVDHRTDVYALGATLYELLTLRPAFPGTDRQELLRQIAFEEPVRPRRLAKGAPAELETIVLKALEKSPADRYATAKELADDLRRFLDDRPIRARRPSLRQVAGRWARRHRAAVWAAAAVLLAAAVLGGGTWLSWAQRRVGAEAEARVALGEANRLLEQERWPEALSAARRAAGVLAGVGADAGLRRQVEELSKDLEMAQRLQEAHLRGAACTYGYFDGEAICTAYAEAFRWYGLEAGRLGPRQAGERIRARPVHRQLVAALDHWAAIGRDGGGQNWAWAAAAARAADPDGWRGELRDAWERKDRKAVEESLARAPAEVGTSLLVLHLSFLHDGAARNERTVGLLRRAQERHPDDFWANHFLAEYLFRSRPPQLEEVVRYSSIAVALRPQSPAARLNLGVVLQQKGDLDGAIVQYRAATHLKADFAGTHINLGAALAAQGKLDEAVTEYREALRLEPGLLPARHKLGAALQCKGRLDEAIAEYREAVRTQKNDALGHFGLGTALRDKGRLDDAIAEYREALRLKNDFPAAHNNLGAALRDKGRLDEAVAEYREAVRLREDFPHAHCNLGYLLLDRGQFKDAVKAIRRGHELGSRTPGWRFPSAQWLRRAEQMAELDDRLTAALEGKAQPKGATERLAFAQLCQRYRKRYSAAARFSEGAFADQPALAEDLASGHRYNAACAAALAGCGQGQDAAGLDDKEHARLRKQALDWLRADLGAWRRSLEKAPDKARPAVAKTMQHWLADPDFAGVRGEAALAKLPEAERPRWQDLWEEVEALQRRAAGPAGPPADARPRAKEGPPKKP